MLIYLHLKGTETKAHDRIGSSEFFISPVFLFKIMLQLPGVQSPVCQVSCV